MGRGPRRLALEAHRPRRSRAGARLAPGPSVVPYGRRADPYDWPSNARAAKTSGRYGATRPRAQAGTAPRGAPPTTPSAKAGAAAGPDTALERDAASARRPSRRADRDAARGTANVKGASATRSGEA